MINYCLGFAFDHINGKVLLLINKTKPSWQQGKLNGVGGKVEPGEHPVDAMVREFREETGLNTTALDWQKFCIMEGTDWIVHCFRANLNIFEAKSITEEEVELVSSYWIYKTQGDKEDRLISNIRWLIEMSKDPDALKNPLTIKYK